MTAQECIHHLPSGLDVGQHLHGGGVFGDVFEVEDRRSVPERPTKRVVRFVRMDQYDEKCQEQFRSRLAQLLGTAIPYVSTPIEAGLQPNGCVYLLTDRFDLPLSAKILPDHGLPPKDACPLIHQLLLGLAGLHRRQIAHGDLRLKNVFLAHDGDTGQPTAWIADAAIGNLAWLTQGTMKDTDSAHYRPPEWKGNTCQPSMKADLYALGLVACELLLGTHAIPKEDDSLAEGLAWAHVRPKLKAASVPRATRQLIKTLLSDKDSRPNNADEAVRRFEQMQIHVPKTTVHTAVLILVTFVALTGCGAWWLWTESQEHSNSLEKDIAPAKATRDRDVSRCKMTRKHWWLKTRASRTSLGNTFRRTTQWKGHKPSGGSW
ncbi:MAG: protein kinase [Planctomycetes bacterium]|nr:protein kinase [Planctomycetota bacterium]